MKYSNLKEELDVIAPRLGILLNKVSVSEEEQKEFDDIERRLEDLNELCPNNERIEKLRQSIYIAMLMSVGLTREQAKIDILKHGLPKF
jgi:hypothetical protein